MSEKTKIPHFSLRSIAFYIIWLFLIADTMGDGSIEPYLVAWLSLILLILTQIYDMVWNMAHPRPEKED